MQLDLPTLLWTMTLTSAVLAGAVLTVAWRSKIHQGLALWGLGLFLNTLSYPAFGLRSQGWVQTSIMAANLLTAMTIAIHALAVAEFQRFRARPMPAWWVWLPILLNAGVAWVFMHDDHWRNILATLLQATLALLLLIQAWGPGLEGNRLSGRLVMMTGSTLLLGMMLSRGVLMALQADWDGLYKVPHSVQSTTYFVILAVLLLNTMGFVLMQMERAIAQQHDLATHDGLTGVYNRHALMEALERTCSQSVRDKQSMAVVMIDIDHFKRVNDRYGHLAGDEVLREVARRCQRRLRGADLLARYGGEEFLALLPGTDAGGAAVVAEAIRQTVAASPVRVHDLVIDVTVSLGVHGGVAVSAKQDDIEGLIAAGDQALYQAKELGRNQVVVV